MSERAAPATGRDAEVLRALGRAAVYRVLARGFAYPSPETPAALAAAARAAGAPEVSGAAGSPEAGEVRAALAAFGAAANDADAAEVATEHVRLFDGVAACPPYEAAWGRAPQPAGKGAGLADIAGFYAAFGLEPAAMSAEVEDHVGAELEFMSALALREAHALDQGHVEGFRIVRAAQVAFLTDHLGRWAEAFAGELATVSALAYHRTLAALLARWVAAEVAALGAAPARAAGRAPAAGGEVGPFVCPMVPAEADE